MVLGIKLDSNEQVAHLRADKFLALLLGSPVAAPGINWNPSMVIFIMLLRWPGLEETSDASGSLGFGALLLHSSSSSSSSSF